MKHTHYLFLFFFLYLQSGITQVPYVSFNANIQLCLDEQVLTCGASAIDFGEQAVGTQINKEITIKNTGKSMLIISGYELAGFLNFSVNLHANQEGDVYIPAGGQHVIALSFHANSEGVHTGSFSLQTNDPDQTPCTILLTGTAFIPFPLQIRYTDDPIAGYEEISCGGESYFDETADQTYSSFRIYFSFKNQSDAPIIVRVTSVLGTLTNVVNPIVLAPGASGFHGPTFWLHPGEIHTILTTFFVELADGTLLECEYRTTIDKRLPLDNCLNINFTDDPANGYQQVDCGEVIYLEDWPNLSGPFRVYYVLSNTCENELTIEGESTLVGSGTHNQMPPKLLVPGLFAFHGPTFHLEAQAVHTITTTFSTVEDYPQHCTITVIVDKTGKKESSSIRLDQVPESNTSLFPTLSKDHVFLQWEAFTDTNYRIFNLAGQMIKAGKIIGGQTLTQISVSDLPDGAYFLKLENHPESLRFIKAQK